MSLDEPSANVLYHCKNCSAELTVLPGTVHLTCQFCGSSEEIAGSGSLGMIDIDYEEYLASAERSAPSSELAMVNCRGCSAEISVSAETQADKCPYCGTSYITEDRRSVNTIQPGALLPFKVKQNEAAELFQKWVKRQWFAPGDFVRAAKNRETIRGIYLPFWSYDCTALSHYTGQRGEHYYVTEQYTEEENGKSVTKTRRVQKTRWFDAHGSVTDRFNDLIIPAGTSLPEKFLLKLEPWDLDQLAPFSEAYLQGYSAQRYALTPVQGFDTAKIIMEKTIRKTVTRDIGGDEQVISTLASQYNDVSFKYILLPVWTSAYRRKDTVYRVMINARTGEVQGERPWSWVKISALVLSILSAGAAIYLCTGGSAG